MIEDHLYVFFFVCVSDSVYLRQIIRYARSALSLYMYVCVSVKLMIVLTVFTCADFLIYLLCSAPVCVYKCLCAVYVFIEDCLTVFT